MVLKTIGQASTDIAIETEVAKIRQNIARRREEARKDGH